LHRFLAVKNPDAAARAMRAIRAKLRMLARFPRLGPAEPDNPNHRELFIKFGAGGYVARYRLDERTVVIVAIRHAAEAGYS